MFTDFYDKEFLIKVDEYCRKNNKAFIYSGSLGLYGFIFADFGSNHLVKDANGDPISIGYIDTIMCDNKDKNTYIVILLKIN